MCPNVILHTGWQEAENGTVAVGFDGTKRNRSVEGKMKIQSNVRKLSTNVLRLAQWSAGERYPILVNALKTCKQTDVKGGEDKKEADQREKIRLSI